MIYDALWDFLRGLDLGNKRHISPKESLVKRNNKLPEIFDGPLDSQILRAISILPFFRKSREVYHKLLHVVLVKCSCPLLKDFLKDIWILRQFYLWFHLWASDVLRFIEHVAGSIHQGAIFKWHSRIGAIFDAYSLFGVLLELFVVVDVFESLNSAHFWCFVCFHEVVRSLSFFVDGFKAQGLLFCV